MRGGCSREEEMDAESRGGAPNTPTPSWKMTTKSGGFRLQGRNSATLDEDKSGSSSSSSVAPQLPNRQLRHSPNISARKLAASLWEELQSKPHPDACSPCSLLQSLPSPLSASDSSLASAHLPLPKAPDMVGSKSPQPAAVAATSPPLKTIAILRPNASREPSSQRIPVTQSVVTYGSSLGMDELKQDDSLQIVEACDATSPRHYVKTFNRLRPFEDQKAGNTSFVAALRAELERARARVQELESAQESACKEVDGLLRKCAEERTMLRRDQEKLQAAILSTRKELEEERNVRKKLEVHNRKLSRNLYEANKGAIKAVKERDKERKARQLMEDVCDELAREIGEDKAKVETLKRNHAKARGEIEEERKMMQMAEIWREERVQMKLAEARHMLEENSRALDKLRVELEVFLSTRKASHQFQGDIEQHAEANRAEMLRQAVGKLQARTVVSMRLMEDATCQHQEPVDAGSSDGIHSLRLPSHNMDGESDWTLYSTRRINGEGGLWTNRRYSSRRRRKQAVITSYGSRADGLNRLGEKAVAESSFRDGESGVGVGSDGQCSDWGYASDRRYGKRGDPRNWSADPDDESGSGRDDGSPWQSGVEEESSSSPEFHTTYKLSDTPIRIEGQPVAVFKQSRGSRSACTTAAAGSGNFLLGSDFLHPEDGESMDGFSPSQQQPRSGMGSRAFQAPRGSLSHAGTGNCGIMQEERCSLEGPLDWRKPVRSNSLQAKLLEDRLDSPQFKRRYPWRVKHKGSARK